MPASILIVDDEKNTRDGLTAVLEDDYEIYTARDAEEAFRVMEAEAPNVVLTDLRMAGKSGMYVIDKALSISPQPICIMMTAYGDITTAVAAMKRGADEFLTKPLNVEQLEVIIKRLLQDKNKAEKAASSTDKKVTETTSKKSSNIIGNSRILTNVLDKVQQVAPTKSSALLLGETGTGKELIAKLIHDSSPRSDKPFIAVHCAAINPNLLESELFGHEKGAFTGANERRIGRFEAANGGTLFLDEIGEIDATTQVKLLRFLETHSFERLGSIDPINVDIRLVCATHRNLEEMVSKGDFREDLFYRLSVIPLNLPSLRERKDDIPLLLEHFIQQYSSENNLNDLKISDDALEILKNYNWPGNIRELRNFCENVVIMRNGEELTQYDLDSRFRDPAKSPPPDGSSSSNPLSKEENEKVLLRNALMQTHGNRTKAAELLGISRRTLHRKLLQWPDLDVNN